jgi:serine/threonine-protein kinase SRK2
MLAARQCKSGYSGVKADMWAVGILMFVMLLGTFPFDHDEAHDPNSAEAANEVWLKQQQQGWRKHPRAADVLKRRVLSEACCDLMDRLLEMDEVRKRFICIWGVLCCVQDICVQQV